MTALDLLLPRGNAALITIRRDGRPQISNVSYHYDAARKLIRVSITDGRAKTRNLRRDPRASMYLTSPDGWQYVVIEGMVELSPVAGSSHDATVDELVDLYRAVRGEHPDWDEYRAAMVNDRRLVLRLSIDRISAYPPG